MSQRDQARYLNLRMEPASTEAIFLTKAVAAEISKVSEATRKSPSRAHLEAVGALCADLIKAGAHGVSSYRPMGRSTFTGNRIGYRPFKSVVEGMKAAGLIAATEGFGGGKLTGTATRFNATSKLLAVVKLHGIELDDWQSHFRSIPRPSEIDQPLILKSSSSLIGGRKRDGVRMPVDLTTAMVAAFARQVEEINAYFARVQIDPDSEHYAFQRIFNEGNRPGFVWNKGGRLYSMGDCYQQRKSVERGKLKLNGEAVVEIDIRASFLTILHAKLGISFNPAAADPYYHPEIPRSVVKRWVVMTMGHDRFQRAWSSDMITDYREATGKTLGHDFPIKVVRAEVLKLLPVLCGWETSSIRWGDMQFAESESVIGAVHELATVHDIPALPVHDSIIVPVSTEALSKSVLSSHFKRQVGVEPALLTK